MLPLLIALQVSSAPPVPPPPADSLAAALSLWADHPPPDNVKQMAIDKAIGTAVSQALYQVGIQPSNNIDVTTRYLAKYDQLRPLIARRVAPFGAAIEHTVAECAVGQIARALTPEEIKTVKAFMATQTGDKFWSASGISYWPLERCYQFALDLKVTDADYRAAGLKPPPAPKPQPLGNVVYD